MCLHRECQCGLDDDREEPGRSIDGSIAEYCYGLKDKREDRKHEHWLEEREERAEMKLRGFSCIRCAHMASEKSFEGFEAKFYHKIEEHCADYKRQTKTQRIEGRRAGNTIGIRTGKRENEAVYTYSKSVRRQDKAKRRTSSSDMLAGQDFDKFSSDHVRRYLANCHNDVAWFAFPRGPTIIREMRTKNTTDNRSHYADVDLGYDSCCEFDPFRHPNLARRDDVKVKSTDG